MNTNKTLDTIARIMARSVKTGFSLATEVHVYKLVVTHGESQRLAAQSQTDDEGKAVWENVPLVQVDVIRESWEYSKHSGWEQKWQKGGVRVFHASGYGPLDQYLAKCQAWADQEQLVLITEGQLFDYLDGAGEVLGLYEGKEAK